MMLISISKAERKQEGVWTESVAAGAEHRKSGKHIQTLHFIGKEPPMYSTAES